MDIEHTVQILQNMELNGYKLTKEQREFLDRYEQATNDLFGEWLEAVY